MIQMHTRTESMETIVEKEMVLTPACHQRHNKIPFVLTKAYQSLYANFSFSTQRVDREKALVIISQVLPDYFGGKSALSDLDQDQVRLTIQGGNLSGLLCNRAARAHESQRWRLHD